METSCKDCVAGMDMEGTATPWWPGLTASWLEPEVRVSSRGLTLDMIGWIEVSGARVGRLVVLVNSILTSNTHFLQSP